MTPNLKTTFEGEGRYQDNNHITKKEKGTLPLIIAAQILGKKGERRDWHYENGERYFGNYPEAAWKKFVENVKRQGILNPVFIVVEWVSGEPKAFVYEGNHRIKAAIQAGLGDVPVEVRYFGHSERDFEWPQRHINKRYQAKMSNFKKPNPEMVSFFKQRTQEHINRVSKYMKKLKGFPGLESSELAKRAREHDKDKYSDSELVLPYIWITEYYRVKNEEDSVPSDLQAQYDLASDASDKHVHRNLHHPEAHSSPTDMELIDLAEMVADWSAMAEELGEGSARKWAEKNVGSKWKFSPEQEETIYDLIDWISSKNKKAIIKAVEVNPADKRFFSYESADRISDCQGAEIFVEELMYEFPFLEKLDEIHAAIRDQKGVDDGVCIELAEEADLLVHRTIAEGKTKQSKTHLAVSWGIKPSKSNPGYYSIIIQDQNALNTLSTIFPEMKNATWLQEEVAKGRVVESVKIDGYKDGSDHWEGWVTWEDEHSGLDVSIKRKWNAATKEDWLEFKIRAKAGAPRFEITKPITGRRTYRNINVKNEIAWVFKQYLDSMKGQTKMAKGRHYRDEPYRVENGELKVYNPARTEEEAHDEATILAENYPGYKFKIYKGSKLIGTVSWNRGSFEVTTAKVRKAMPQEDEIASAIDFMLGLKRGPAVWRAAETILDEMFSWEDSGEFGETYIGLGQFYPANIHWYAEVTDESIQFYRNNRLVAHVVPFSVIFPHSVTMGSSYLVKGRVRKAMKPENEIGEAIAYMLNLKRGPAVWQMAMAIIDELFYPSLERWDDEFDYFHTVGNKPFYEAAVSDDIIGFYVNGVNGKLIARVSPYGVEYPPSAIMGRVKRRRTAQPEKVYVANIDWCDRYGDDTPLVEIYAVSEKELKKRVKLVRRSIVADEVEESGQDTDIIEDQLCDDNDVFAWNELASDYLDYLDYSNENFIGDLIKNLITVGHFIYWP